MSLMKKESSPATMPAREPFDMLREMTSEVDRFFGEPFGRWGGFRWPSFRTMFTPETFNWSPSIDVFEKDNRLITRVDLPGMKKEDVKVEVADGYLTISGERKFEKTETKEQVYRAERSYGTFYRAVPLPEGAKLEDVKATFADGVLEVSVPLPEKAVKAPRTVAIEAAAPAGAKTAA